MDQATIDKQNKAISEANRKAREAAKHLVPKEFAHVRGDAKTTSGKPSRATGKRAGKKN